MAEEYEEFEDFLSERVDDISNAAFDLLKAVSREPLIWDFSMIGPVIDYAERTLMMHVASTCYPYHEGDGETPCVLTETCDKVGCPFINRERR